MVTKLTKLISPNPLNAVHITRGYESARLVINVTEITTNGALSLTVSYDDTNPTSSSKRATAYYNGLLLTGNLSLNAIGEYIIDIDVSNVNKLRISQTGSITQTSVLSTSYQEIDIKKEDDQTVDVISANRPMIVQLPYGSRQLDFSIYNNNSTGYFYLEGSVDGVNYSAIPFICSNNKRLFSTGYINIATYGEDVNAFANIEGFKNIRFRSTVIGNSRLNYIIHREYLEGRVVPGIADSSALAGFSIFRGYKFIKVNLKDCVIKNNTGRFYLHSMSDENGKAINTKCMRDLSMKKIDSYFLSSPSVMFLFGSCSGGFIFELEKPIYVGGRVVTAADSVLPGSEFVMNYELTYYTKAPQPVNFPVVKEGTDYSICQLPSMDDRKDVYNRDVLEYTGANLSFYMFGYNGIKYSIPFNNETVPSLIAGEAIVMAYLFPFDMSNRSNPVGSERFPSRIVILTNRNRVLHNFPVRGGSGVPYSDMGMFDESAVYNNKKKWLPVNSKLKADAKHKYLPILKDYDYNQFEGRVSGSDGFVDYFGNGGINASNGLLLDFQVSNTLLNDLAYSNVSKGPKMSAFGNYNAGNGGEPFVMVTNNGGRTWYVLAYFACTDDYDYMYSGNIDLTPISSVAAFVPNSLKMCRRRYNVPTKDIKEPDTPFIINENEKSLVTYIEVLGGETIITVADNVDYSGSCPVVYFENVSANSEWDYICNNAMTADGDNSNGVFFRVKKVSGNRYKLYADIGNPYESDAFCRHVHAVNAFSAGFLISTGESYTDKLHEGGFLYMLQQNYKNGRNIVGLTPQSSFPLVRLTSAAEGVNRACGAFLFTDEADPTLLYVSDEAFETGVAKRYAEIPGRTKALNIVPAGVFMGKLSDIDDQSKFKCVCDFSSTIISLVQHHGHFAADGHTGALLISKDGKNWSIETNEKNNRINGTDLEGNIYYGDKVIVFK